MTWIDKPNDCKGLIVELTIKFDLKNTITEAWLS